MTENNKNIYNYGVDHTRFGGLIYLSDFNTNYCKRKGNVGSEIASRILSDKMFDEQCKKNIECKQRRIANRKLLNT